MTHPALPRVLVIIPAYEEGPRIGAVVREVHTAAPGVDVVVVDDGSSDDTAARAREAGARVLAFSMHEDTIFVEQALQAGARGYIGKSSAPVDLVEAVRQIANGNIYIDAEMAQRIAFQKTKGADSPFQGLSTREFEIFCLLAEGLSVNEISPRLSLSSKTVANYATQIKAKLEEAGAKVELK